MSLKYAIYDHGYWTSCFVDGGQSGYYSNLALDSSGRPHLAYYDNKDHDLKYAELMAEPDAPRNLEATAGEGEVTLAWRAPWQDHGSDVTSYRIYRSEGEGPESLLFTVDDVLEVVDQAAYGGTYHYRVAAVNVVGIGPKSDVVEVTVEATAFVPDEPENLEADAENGTVTLTWDPPDDDGGMPVTSYKIYRGTTEGAEVLIATVINATTYADDSVLDDVTYYYKVTAVNSVGEGPASSTVDINTGAEEASDGSMIMNLVLVVVIVTAISLAMFWFLKRKKK
jgi:fibronectin type 3 domain-containing protein